MESNLPWNNKGNTGVRVVKVALTLLSVKTEGT